MSGAVLTHRALVGKDLAEGACVGLVLAGWPVLAARDQGQVFAVIDRCPHAAARLSDGRIRRGAVACPLHDARFRLSDGASLGGGHPALATFAVRETADGWIDIDVPAGPPGPEHLPV